MWDYALSAFTLDRRHGDESGMTLLLNTMAERMNPTILAAGCLNFLGWHEQDSEEGRVQDFVRNLVKKGAAAYPVEVADDEMSVSSERKKHAIKWSNHEGNRRTIEWTPQSIYNLALQNMKEWEVWRANGRREDEMPDCYKKYRED
jgi:hypothetical protein